MVNTMLKPWSNCGHAHCGGGGGVGRGSWYVQCNISHTIDSLESPTPFNAAKQATLQCVKKKKALNAASLCVTTQWFSPRSIA